VHGHQPQIANLCDIFECHYLTRASTDRGCWDARPGLTGVLARAQEAVVRVAEDRCYRAWNPSTELVCESPLTEREFDRLYGLPPLHDVQTYPAPAWCRANPEARRRARAKLAGGWTGPVVGFLGGMDRRKGFEHVVRAVTEDPTSCLLLAGMHSQEIAVPAGARDRCHRLGLLDGVDEFYAAIDVLAVPSAFEPFGLVCSEAVSRGVPVIASGNVGALPYLLRYETGEMWAPTRSWVEPIRALLSVPESSREANCRRMLEAMSMERFRERLLERYERARERRARRAADGRGAVMVGQA
jgi:glycosyltransferase involved in cell wall biosynthesis